jgi:hypothetical protein
LRDTPGEAPEASFKWWFDSPAAAWRPGQRGIERIRRIWRIWRVNCRQLLAEPQWNEYREKKCLPGMDFVRDIIIYTLRLLRV